MIIERTLKKELQTLMDQYPVVTLTGPRQSGKTMLAKTTFPHKPYVNLEAHDTRQQIAMDPRGFLEQYPEGAIVDEIQRLPALLSYIQVRVDERPDEKGLYVLTGSHQLALHEAITQSLAGRTALLRLLPFSIQELQQANIELSLDEYLLYGFFPRIHKEQLDPTKAYRNYFQTYIERDVRQLINIKNLSLFQKFMKLCAGRVGQLINYDSLGNELGLSGHTIREWLSILEASFIIFRLEPYFENFGKRIIKSSKLFFTDVGIVSYLLDIETIAQVARDPLRGGLIENLVLLELIKARLNQGKDPHFYFYRDSQQKEVDIIYKVSHALIPIEVKSSKTVHQDFFKGLHFFKKLVGERCPKGYLIYAGMDESLIQSFQTLNFKKAYQLVSASVDLP